DSDVLFGAGAPRAFEFAQVARKRKPKIPRNDEFRLEHGSTLHYTVWSDLEAPPVDKLRAASTMVPPGYGVYLQLPPEITIPTRTLAVQITSGLTNNYDKAIAIESW